MKMMTSITTHGLDQLPAPPILGPRHLPLPHGRFVRIINDTLVDHKIAVKHQDIEVSHGGARIFGTIRLLAPPEIRELSERLPSEIEPVLGFKNATDCTFGARTALAARVFNCSNGMWIVENGFEVSRKNTQNQESHLRGLMRDMVRQYWQQFRAVLATQEAQVNTELTDREAHHLICEGSRNGVTTHANSGHVLEAWHERPFDWGDKSVWRLHQCFTYVLDRKVKSPYVRAERNLKLNNLIAYHRPALARRQIASVNNN